MWSPVTRSPAIFLQRSPASRMRTPAPGTPGCLWALERPPPQISEARGGHPGSSRQLGVTPEETRVHTCWPGAQPHLCSTPRTGSPCGRAQGPRTADTAPTGAALMATPRLLGRSGKAALGPHVIRAGLGAALTGCLWLRGPIKLAARGLMDVTTPGAGQGQEQWLPQPPKPASPRPSRMSPVSVGLPSSAVAMTMWPLRPALLGKAVWASPATHTLCGACCPAPTAPAQTGLPAGTSLPLWASVIGSGTAAAMATPITSPRRRRA